MSKYDAIGDEGEDYHSRNLLRLTDDEHLDWAEYSGAFWAEVAFTEGLTSATRFTLDYLLALRLRAFGHLYTFAGKLRTVNLSKDDYSFPPSLFLLNTMQDFEKNFLRPLLTTYLTEELLRRDIARVHAELLFIHPFREGNGRTARILANLMAAQHGYKPLNFDAFSSGSPGFARYVRAVQQAGNKCDYQPMEVIIAAAWTGPLNLEADQAPAIRVPE